MCKQALFVYRIQKICYTEQGSSEIEVSELNGRMNRAKLHIGAYCLAPYAQSEQHIRDIAGCGIDMMLCVPNDLILLDRFAACGVGAVVSGVVPGWFGGMGENAGQMAKKNPLDGYSSEAFFDHPAIWGIDIGDEPSSLDFPHYGKVFDRVRTQFSNQFPYLNLYPGYAMVAWNTPQQVTEQLGAESYEEYIDRYCKNVPSDYICFDFYPYAANAALFWDNLKTVADACKKTNRSLWTVLQVNSHDSNVWTSVNRLRFQAYSALAFGAECIFWACYTAGWWHNQVLDERGEKTEQYGKLQRVNAELRSLGETYMRYRRMNTYIVENSPLSVLGFCNVCAAAGERLLVGEMISRNGDGSRALMICAANDPMDEHPGNVMVRFSTTFGWMHAVKGGGTAMLSQDEDGVYSLELPSCGGVMLIAEEDED